MGVVIPKEIEALAETYEVEMGAGDLIAAHGHLLPFLQELAPALREFFPDALLRLHFARDPETGRESEMWVLAHLDPSADWRAASDALDEFDRSWWNANAHRVRGLVAVDIRFLEDEE